MKIIKTAALSFDIVLRHYGREVMPLIVNDGVEVYRGEYKSSPEEALQKAQQWMEQRNFLSEDFDSGEAY